MRALFTNLKTRLLVFAVVLPAMCISGCKDPDKISVNPDKITMAGEGETRYVQVTASSDWRVTNAPDWIAFDEASGSGSRKMEVTVRRNDDAERNFDLQLKSGDNICILKITQPLGKPEAAGEIQATENHDGTYNLSITELPHATSYKWYLNNVAISGADQSSYTATESGLYKVAGVNAVGEGQASPEKEITGISQLIDKLVGTWTVAEYVINNVDKVIQNDHDIVISKVSPTQVKISNLMNVENLGIGDEFTATINNINKTLTLDAMQPIVPSWHEEYLSFLIPMYSDTYSDGYGVPFPASPVLEINGKYTIEIVGGSGYSIIVMGERLPASWAILAVQNNDIKGGFIHGIGTTWTKSIE